MTKHYDKMLQQYDPWHKAFPNQLIYLTHYLCVPQSLLSQRKIRDPQQSYMFKNWLLGMKEKWI